jgi:hypothetical protein
MCPPHSHAKVCPFGVGIAIDSAAPGIYSAAFTSTRSTVVVFVYRLSSSG